MVACSTTFTLVAVTSRDGCITGPRGEPPAAWASPEEQRSFAQTVAHLDWSFIGRITHCLAWRPDRRRVVFSRTCRRPLWRHPVRLWVDPTTVAMPTILETIATVRAPRRCGILGGVGVHDWFVRQGLIDAAEITIEPMTFESGLPLLTGAAGQDPLATLAGLGLRLTDSRLLNRQGTRLYRLRRGTTATPAG